MTLLTTLLLNDPPRAIVACDDLAFDIDGNTIPGTDGKPRIVLKALAMPAHRLVIAVQGTQETLAFIVANSTEFRDIDSAMHVMPSLLEAAGEAMDLAPRGVNIGSFVNLIGYSYERECMVMARWKTKDGKTFTPSLIRGDKARIVVCPQAPAWLMGGKLPSDTASLTTFVRAQAKHAQDRGLSVGGRCTLIAIDRHSITSSVAAELGMPGRRSPITIYREGELRERTAVDCILEEDSPEIYDEADAAVADPTPNTRLPNPYYVQAITGLAATSSSSTALKSNLGVITPRISVTWNAVTDRYVIERGLIRIRWRFGSQPWVTQDEPGDSTGTYIVGPKHGDRLVIEVYAINALGKEGPPSQIAHTVVGAATGQIVFTDSTTNSFAQAATSSSTDVTTTVLTMSKTNTTPNTIRVDVDFSCFQIYLYDYGSQTTHVVYIDQTGAVGGATTDNITGLTNGDVKDGLSKLFQYQLAAGQTITIAVKMHIISASISAAINMDAAVLRVTGMS